jgi:hypothetical protein
MERVQTKFNGVTTTSSYEEGDFISLVNLRKKNGVLTPVTPRKVVSHLNAFYNIVFIHKNNDYENWLGIINQGGTFNIYSDIKNEPDKIQTINEGVNGTVTGIEQIGNTVSIITTDNTYYILYKGNSYTFLGNMPDLPVISLRTTDPMPELTYNFSDEYDDISALKKENLTEIAKGMINKAMDVFVNGGTVNGSSFTGKETHLFDACYIRYAFRLYDGTLTKHSPPILVLPSRNIYDIKIMNLTTTSGKFTTGSNVKIFGYRIEMKYDFSGLTLWNDIIQSVDLFISEPLGISSAENIKDDLHLNYPNLDFSTSYTDIQLINNISKDRFERIKAINPLFFIRSLNLNSSSQFTDTTPVSFPNDNDKFDSLLQQEVMSDDNFSHHKYGADVSYVYNNRLHLANIKTNFFRGYDLNFFQWHGKYNGINNTAGFDEYPIILEIEIHASGKIKEIYTEITSASGTKFFGNALLSYPDTRAKAIAMYRKIGENKWRRFFRANLIPSDTMNIAYVLNTSLQPWISNAYNEFIDAEFPPDSDTLTLTEANKIKVSELSNPMVFPNRNVYTVGDGEILAMATNSMNVADQNYGQYPLYIFTTQGIWTMNVGQGEVGYSTLAAPTSTETPVSKSICPTPFGVVFISKKGLMLINGHAIEFISPQLEESPKPTVYINMPIKAEGVIMYFMQHWLGDFLKGVDNILYDPYESELIISNRSWMINYVLNIPSKAFYLSTEAFDRNVKNAYPELLVFSDGNEVKSYAESQTNEVHVSFITRPLSFGVDDIKQLDRMILRGVFPNMKNPFEEGKSLLMISRSNDDINFQTERGIILNPANYRDIDMGLMARNKFRKFILSFGGKISKESKIVLLDSMIAKEYANEKMR